MKDLVSIIVPVYNVEKYLDRCVESIISQTYKKLEIILVDDGSEDQSGHMCDKWTARDSRIKVIHKENGGAVSARKEGILLATGDYACMVDSDDWIEKQMIEDLLGIIKKNDVDLVISYFCNSMIASQKGIFKEGVYECCKDEEFFYSHMLYETEGVLNRMLPGSLCGKMYKRNLLTDCQLRVDNRIVYAEDGACVWSYLLKVKKIYFSYKEYYHYNKRENSTMSTKEDSECWMKIGYLYNFVKEIFQEHKYNKVLMEQLDNYIIKDLLLILTNKIVPTKKIVPVFQIPYSAIPIGSNIIIYGAGAVGKSIFRQIKENGYYNVVAWIDKNYKTCKNCEVVSIDMIKELQFDYVLLATSQVEVLKSMLDDVIKQGILEEKIIAQKIKKTEMFLISEV